MASLLSWPVFMPARSNARISRTAADCAEFQFGNECRRSQQINNATGRQSNQLHHLPIYV